jgi:hypothetical protein
MTWEYNMWLSQQIIIKQSKKRDLQETLAALATRSRNLNKDIMNAKGYDEKGGFQGTLTLVEEEIDEVAIAIDQLRRDIENLISPQLRSLHGILVSISPDIVLSAYKYSLSGRADLDHNQPILDMLLHVAELSEDQLPRFISRIIADSRLNLSRKESLQQWLQNQNLSQTDFPPAKQYLMIRVKLSQYQKYLVGAVLTEALDHWQPPAHEEIPVEHWLRDDRNSRLVGYSESELRAVLPSIFSDCLKACVKKYGVDRSKLIVEWFLPVTLLDLPVEHWKTLGDGIGTSCCYLCESVVIRIRDPNYKIFCDDSLPTKRNRWQQLWGNPQLSCSKTLEDFGIIDGPKYLKCLNPEVIGCTFIVGANQPQKDFWEAFFEQGISVALWLRESSSSMDSLMAENFMSTVVAEDIIGELPMASTRHRKSRILGVENLSLLWDSPFRSFSDDGLVYECKDIKVDR